MAILQLDGQTLQLDGQDLTLGPEITTTPRSSDLMLTAAQPKADPRIQFYIPAGSNADLSSGVPWVSGGRLPYLVEAGYQVQQ